MRSHPLIFVLFLLAATLLCTLSASREASAQSVAVGFGLGIPFTSYIENEVGREYRVSPKPGYYPILRELNNAVGSIHLNASLLLNVELGPFQKLGINFSASRFLWSTAETTHVSCSPVSIQNNSFSDAATEYYPVDTANCINAETYETTEDISNDDRTSLWFLHLSVGPRYIFFQNAQWAIFADAHLGISVAILNKSYWGGALDADIGFNYRITDTLYIEFDIELKYMLTQAPEDMQSRINHETQTGGNVLTSFVESYAFVNFLLSLRFDFSNI